MQPNLTEDYLLSQGFTPTIPNRFWEKVKQPEDPSVGCWVWKGSRNKCGYGKIGTGIVRGMNALAHRVSWVMHFGPIPIGLNVLHMCDNPSCIRPDHLWLGTDSDNMSDSARKGRNVSRKQPELLHRKLTPKQVANIREVFSPYRHTIKQLSQEFGVGKSTIANIVYNFGWKHIPTRPIKQRLNGHKLSVNQVSEIKHQYATGLYSWMDLARIHGVTKHMVGCIVRGTCWKWVS